MREIGGAETQSVCAAYTVAEDAVDGYEAAITGTAEDGFTVTNTHESEPGPGPETVDVPVSKVWSDSDNADKVRPSSVTVHLLADGKDIGQKLVLSADNEWKGSFENLPVTNASGEEIAYTVSEDAVSGYTAKVSGTAKAGFTVTNTHTTTPPTKKSTITRTGDPLAAGPLAGLALASAACALVAAAMARRKRR